jgi:hypothetical protein
MSDMEYLGLYAELALALVAFMSIIGTIRQAFGNHLDPQQ